MERPAIAVTDSEHELASLFRARYQALVTEGKHLPENVEGMIFNQFECHAATTNLIATVDSKVIGGLQLVRRTSAGTPADRFFDFTPHIVGGTALAATLYFVLSAFRRNRVGFYLFAAAIQWAIQEDFDYMYFAANPELEMAFLRMGCQLIGPLSHYEQDNLPFIPLVLDLSQVAPKYLQTPISVVGKWQEHEL